jgi:hypothetical protein
MEFFVIMGLIALPIIGTFWVRKRTRMQVRFYESN